ncbi:dienelactone hydrolase family protein [Lichenicoccus sp.]|uniref:dienelactone hydrolase family protein n=1 Tax=Lichenicoccus sp. TaxID=2781899 RepID=UPI003D0FF019
MRAWLLAKLSAVLAFGIGSWLELAYPGLSRPNGDLPVGRFGMDAAQLGMPVAQLPLPAAAGPADRAGFTRTMQADFFYPAPAAAQRDGSVARAAAAPVLIYFPGWPGTESDNPRLLTDLASHGYVVVQARIVQEDPRLAGAMDFSTDAAAKATLLKAQAKVGLQAHDATALLDALHRLAASGADRRFGPLALDRVGILGFSFGGAVAAQAAATDRRFLAVLNMDGWLFGQGAELGFPQPYFLMSDDEADPTAADLASPDTATRETARLTERDLRRMRSRLQAAGAFMPGAFMPGALMPGALMPGALMMVIKGTGHESFSDSPLHYALRGHGMPGPVQALRVSVMIRRYAEAFFAQQLRGEASPLLASAASPYKEITLTLPP